MIRSQEPLYLTFLPPQDPEKRKEEKIVKKTGAEAASEDMIEEEDGSPIRSGVDELIYKSVSETCTIDALLYIMLRQ